MQDNILQHQLTFPDYHLFTIYSQSQLEEGTQSPICQTSQTEIVGKKNQKSASYDLENRQIRKVNNDILSGSENYITAKQNYLHMKYSNFISKKLSNKMLCRKRNLYNRKSNERQLIDKAGFQTMLMQKKHNQEQRVLENSKKEDQRDQSKTQKIKEHQINKNEACQQSRKQSLKNFLLEEKENESQKRIGKIVDDKSSRDKGYSKQTLSTFKNVEQNKNKINVQLKTKI